MTAPVDIMDVHLQDGKNVYGFGKLFDEIHLEAEFVAASFSVHYLKDVVEIAELLRWENPVLYLTDDGPLYVRPSPNSDTIIGLSHRQRAGDKLEATDEEVKENVADQHA